MLLVDDSAVIVVTVIITCFITIVVGYEYDLTMLSSSVLEESNLTLHRACALMRAVKRDLGACAGSV